MPSVDAKLKTQAPLTLSHSNISTPITRKEFKLNYPEKEKTETDSFRAKTEKKNSATLSPDSKVGLSATPTYKIVPRMEDKDRVKVGFVVANGPVVGMHVVKVTQKLPADLAGLKVGDIIHVINGHQTMRVEDFRLVAANFRSGDVVPIKITRVEDLIPRSINLIMRIPAVPKDPLTDNTSPQKENARQLKLELAKLKEEKEKAERESIEKLRKEKQKLLADKKAKETQMREELEKRKIAAKEKRKEMKQRQQQLKNEEVLLLKELRLRRAARKAEGQAQLEMSKKQKMEELAKVHEEEQKWAQVLLEEEKQRLKDQKIKHEEIKKLKEEQRKKREEQDKIRKDQEKLKEIEKKKQDELLAKEKEQKHLEFLRIKEEHRKQRETEQKKKRPRTKRSQNTNISCTKSKGFEYKNWNTYRCNNNRDKNTYIIRFSIQ